MRWNSSVVLMLLNTLLTSSSDMPGNAILANESEVSSWMKYSIAAGISSSL